MTNDELDDGIVTNILASLVTCFLISIEREMPNHTLKARLTRKLEEAIVAYAKPTGLDLSERQAAIGVKLYNKLLDEFQRLLEEDIPAERQILLGEIDDKAGRAAVNCA